jgi:hypothetical protein
LSKNYEVLKRTGADEEGSELRPVSTLPRVASELVLAEIFRQARHAGSMVR